MKLQKSDYINLIQITKNNLNGEPTGSDRFVILVNLLQRLRHLLKELK